MQRRFFHGGGGCLVACALVAGAQAETAMPSLPAAQDAAEARPAAAAERPAVQSLPAYRSPLSEYRPYRADEPLRPWRDANDEVGRLGGHMGHLERPADGGAR